MPEFDNNQPAQDVLSVSRLASEVRAVLEGSFPLLWIAGEISNLAQPRSGHLYFSLKDANSQVRCAMFRNRRSLLRFLPRDGEQVLVRAKVTYYEPRGDFQLVIEHMQPAGAGAQQRAFEELKARLQAEGLFDPARKQALPIYPRRLGIITSPSGAAIHDVLQVLKRRFPALPVTIYPVPVQGQGAAAAIIKALALAERRNDCDVLLLTRGGGALEDLAEFNDEQLARTIAALRIPLVSAIGHEVDFTLADFVADRRAPTPSAAAELISPDGAAVLIQLERMRTALNRHQRQQLLNHSQRVQQLQTRLHLAGPQRHLQQQQQRLDELDLRVQRSMRRRITQLHGQLERLQRGLNVHTPRRRLGVFEERARELHTRLHSAWRATLGLRVERLQGLMRNLHAVSPLATLERGYAIVHTADSDGIVRSTAQIHPGDTLRVRLHDGIFTASTIKVEPTGG